MGQGVTRANGGDELPVEPPPPDELEDLVIEPPEFSEDPYRAQELSNLLWQPRPEFILPGLMVRNSVTLMVSEPHVGKTLLTMNLAVSLGAHREFLGRLASEPVNVLAFWLDSPVWDLRDALEGVAAGRGIQPGDVHERVHYKPRSVGRRIDLAVDEHIGKLCQSVKHHRARVLILDCFSNCNSADENDRGEMELVMMRAAKIAHDTSCAVVITDHTPVAGREARSVYQARGSSTKETSADSVWHMRTMVDGTKELRVMKARGMRTAGTTFVYRQVADGVKSNGEPGVRFEVVQEIREEAQRTGRAKVEEVVMRMCDGVSQVSDIVAVVMKEVDISGVVRAEQATRNALSRLKKRGEVERVRKNVWQRVGGDDSLDELAGLAEDHAEG